MSDFRLPRLQRSVALVDSGGKPTQAFQQWWQSFAQTIETQEGAQDDLLAAIVAAQTAADNANAAAAGATATSALSNSGVSGTNILTAADAGTDATVTVAAHTRLYGDGTSLAIAGPTDITGLAYSTAYFVYYDDPTRADTTPDYQTTTDEATAAQTGDRHLVGTVTTPAALGAPTDGRLVRPPGVSGIEP